jgi:hypothetical protein
VFLAMLHACTKLSCADSNHSPLCLSLQPYLKFHNPRTFEDMDKPIPNFKKFGLKAGGQGRQLGHYSVWWHRQQLKLSARQSTVLLVATCCMSIDQHRLSSAV